MEVREENKSANSS